MNTDQLAAVTAAGEVFVSAGAGTGKTAVLVERFVRAVCDEGLDVESVLVITYTRKAAGELRSRIRAALVDRGRPDLARDLDGAWISTIHGFCTRLLRAHPFAVGIDPGFHEFDDEHGAVLRGEAFTRALTVFVGEAAAGERRVLLATYGGGAAAQDADRRLRDAPLRRAPARARGGGAGRRSGAAAGAPRGGRLPARRPGSDREPRGRGAGRTRPPVPARDADRPRGAPRARAARRELRGGAQGGRAGRARARGGA